MEQQIAQIIPLTRLKRDLHYFDYAIPADMASRITKGQLVEIPFRNQITKGIIFDLKDKEDEAYEIKEIISLIDPLPLLDAWQLELISYLAKYYFVSMSVLAKMIMPDIPKRFRESKSKSLSNVFKPLPGLDLNADDIYKSSKPVLLRYYNNESRIKAYLALIKESLARNKQIAIIFPQIVDIISIYKYLGEYQEQVSVFLNDLPKNKYWQEWQKIKKGETKIILGTRSAIFAPFNDLDLIIIDEEDNENHKQEEPNPRYNVKTVALRLRELLNCKVIFGSQSPSLAALYKAQQKEWNYFEIDKPQTLPQISVIDRSEEFKKKNYLIFSEKLLQKIDDNYKQAKRTFLFINRKGMATLAACQDCGHIALCPTCKLPLTLHVTKKLYCHHCLYQQDLFLFCPKCHGPNIKYTGTGTEKIEAEIRKLYPAARILKLDHDSPAGDKKQEDYDFIIGTSYAFDYLNWNLLDLIGVINADTFLYLPDWRGMEKTFSLLVKLAVNLNNPDKEIIIQTFTPENYIFQTIKTLDYKNFYLNELRERKAFNYPPYAKLIRLIFQSFDFNGGTEEIEQIYKDLETKTDSARIQISSPTLAYTQQVRGRWRWQIIIKVIDQKEDLSFLNSLPENVIIDVEPENLL